MAPRLLILSSLPLLLAAAPAAARNAGDTARLRTCGADTCVVLRGERADPADAVTVAGHTVAATGGRRFEVAVPVASVRAWSAPFARVVEVGVVAHDGGVTTRAVRLPIGLLGHVTELAALEVRSR
jgi:hypothetical protein